MGKHWMEEAPLLIAKNRFHNGLCQNEAPEGQCDDRMPGQYSMQPRQYNAVQHGQRDANEHRQNNAVQSRQPNAMAVQPGQNNVMCAVQNTGMTPPPPQYAGQSMTPPSSYSPA